MHVYARIAIFARNLRCVFDDFPRHLSAVMFRLNVGGFFGVLRGVFFSLFFIPNRGTLPLGGSIFRARCRPKLKSIRICSVKNGPFFDTFLLQLPFFRLKLCGFFRWFFLASFHGDTPTKCRGFFRGFLWGFFAPFLRSKSRDSSRGSGDLPRKNAPLTKIYPDRFRQKWPLFGASLDLCVKDWRHFYVFCKPSPIFLFWGARFLMAVRKYVLSFDGFLGVMTRRRRNKWLARSYAPLPRNNKCV